MQDKLYVNMQYNYVYMQLIHINKQHNYADILHNL